MKAIKWAYVHGGLEAEIYPSLKDAVIAAERLSDYGAESLQCIEHDGRLIDEYHPEYIEIDRTERERRDRASAEIRAENADRTKVYVEVRGPEGEWSHYGWGYADDDQGWRAEIADLVELLGKDRVRVSDGD